MSNSVQPHRQQPTRLLHPWDSPGKNTGEGCHFLLQYMKVKIESEVTQSCPTLSDPMDTWTSLPEESPPVSSVHGISQARISHCLFMAAKSLQLCPTLCNPIDSSPPGSPIPGILQARTLEWVAISFSFPINLLRQFKELTEIFYLCVRGNTD